MLSSASVWRVRNVRDVARLEMLEPSAAVVDDPDDVLVGEKGDDAGEGLASDGRLHALAAQQVQLDHLANAGVGVGGVTADVEISSADVDANFSFADHASRGRVHAATLAATAP